MSFQDKTDAQLEQDVIAELGWDHRLHLESLGVKVDRGVVTLSGVTRSYAERVAVVEAAHRVPGVLDVVDELRIDIPGGQLRTDSDIAHAVRHALAWDVSVPEERIQSTVSEGIITLGGKVAYWSQREDAERAVRRLAGVRGIVNRIAVEPEDALSRQVHELIREALLRHADRAARHIDVHLEGDRLVLAGRVRSWSDRRIIIGSVLGLAGVREVDVHLRVDPIL